MLSNKMSELLNLAFKSKKKHIFQMKIIHISIDNYNGTVFYLTKLLFGMSASLPPLSFLGKTLLLLCQPLWFSDRLSERQLAGQR